MQNGMQIGELAKHFGLNPKTIRYYEEIGLLPEPRRTESGYRQYDEDAVERLGFIQRAKLLGLSLENIREIIPAQPSDEQPCERVLALVAAEIASIDQRIEELKTFRKELTVLQATWSDVAARQNDATCLCPIIETQAEVDAPLPVAGAFDPIKRRGKVSAAR